MVTTEKRPINRSISQLVKDTIASYRLEPINILNLEDSQGEYTYLSQQGNAYIRTVKDVAELFPNPQGQRILEIGSYLGVVSISLQKLGFDVSAYDIPEFHQSQKLRDLYQRHDISFSGGNLRNKNLPYEDNYFDAVIICETLEHLNFNPLPIIQEMNRILKPEGLLYVAMPNIARINNRVKLIMGRSIHNPVEDFFRQMDKKDNMLVGLHWREYSLAETVKMLEAMGFETKKAYFFDKSDYGIPKNLQSILRKIACVYQPFKSSQVVISQKKTKPEYEFWLTEANQ